MVLLTIAAFRPRRVRWLALVALVVVVAVLAAAWRHVAAAEGVRPGVLVTVPGLGSVSWSCDDARRYIVRYTVARPLTTQRITVRMDGRLVARSKPSPRTHDVKTPPGYSKVVTVRVTERTEPATVTALFSVHLRSVPPPTGTCLVPTFAVTVRTRSHAAGA